MRRSIVGKYLVVANQTVGGDQLMDQVRQRAAAGPSSFYVVVPNTRSVDVVPLPGGPVPPGTAGVATEEDRRATQIAQSRLNQALSRLHAEGVDASGELGDAEPLTAIQNALEGEQFDEIIISTLPLGVSRWLGLDLPSRAERKFKLPVTTVTARG
jgi:GABA permease